MLNLINPISKRNFLNSLSDSVVCVFLMTQKSVCHVVAVRRITSSKCKDILFAHLGTLRCDQMCEGKAGRTERKGAGC